MKLSELITDESKWTKGAAARDHTNFPVAVNSDNACCWCLAGGMSRVLGDDHHGYGKLVDCIRQAIKELFPTRVDTVGVSLTVSFNDHKDTTFSDVVRVIARAEELWAAAA